MKNTYVKAIVLAVLVILLAVVWYFSMKKDEKVEPTPQPVTDTEQKVKATKTEVDSTKVPENFPTDIPIEPGAKIVDNFNATAPDGRVQATRSFESAKSAQENFTFYKNLLTQKGYEIVNTANRDNLQVIFAKKGDGLVNIAILNNQATSMRTVSITYSEATGTAQPTTR